jgi:thymidylate synthase
MVGEQGYLDLLTELLAAPLRTNRTIYAAHSVFGRQIRFNLSEGYPLLTTKLMHTKAIFHELLWFLRGETNIRSLQAAGIRIWNEWADPETAELGPGMYGEMWRRWPTPDGGTIDQIAQVIQQIQTDPKSRRLIVVAYNPTFAQRAVLPPCHSFFQFYVLEDKLSCQLYMRSADVFLGVPFNIASYALLTHMVAQVSNLGVGELILTFGDVHLYQNHEDVAKEQITRSPYFFPTLHLNPAITNIFDFQFKDIEVVNYTHHPILKARVAV